MTQPNEQINYVEFPSRDIESTKAFFTKAFSWSFTDYGPDYTSFEGAGIEGGGFYKSDKCSHTSVGAALLVFYSKDLKATQSKIERHGGTIIKPVFSFPGGRRFHFTEPSGNEFAVWSDK